MIEKVKKSDETLVILKLPKIEGFLKDKVYLGMNEGAVVVNIKFSNDQEIESEEEEIQKYIAELKKYFNYINNAKRTYVYSRVEEEE